MKMFGSGIFAVTASQPSSPESTSRRPKTPSASLMRMEICMYSQAISGPVGSWHWAMVTDGR